MDDCTHYWVGVQIALYAHMKQSVMVSGIVPAVSTSGGISTTSMIACCAHHLSDVLPLIGLSAAAIFLTKYQTLFFIVGILSNLVGITLMLKAIQEHKIYTSANKIFVKLFLYPMERTFQITAAVSAIIFIVTFAYYGGII